MISNHFVDTRRIISIHITISAKTALTTSDALPISEALALTQLGDRAARDHRNSLSHCCGTKGVLVIVPLGHKRAPDPTEDRT